MQVKILKTEKEYETALERIDSLMDAKPGSPQEEQLELLALLVEKYEAEHYPIDLPDPIEAIKFRMDQEGLEPKDMVKYLGSQSKVSEVLNYKRTLSLTMIRALHEGLGIPAEVLLQEADLRAAGLQAAGLQAAGLQAADLQEAGQPGTRLAALSWREFPFAEMFKRGYFNQYRDSLIEAKKHSAELLGNLFSSFQGMPFTPVYCKHAAGEIQLNALKAWQAYALRIAMQQALPEFSRDALTEEFIQKVARLSFYSQGPQMASELLNSIGIHFVLLRHLPKTYLDGACFYAPDRRPVVAMTLRHDRLDNFWFTIVHELAHLYLHFDDGNLAFFDDTDQAHEDPEHPQEAQANALARDMLLPPGLWKRVSPDVLAAQENDAIIRAAAKIGVGAEILAGRVRWECSDFSRFADLVGHKQVRSQFPELI
jgi:HTH-type transcriptional regulator/antitoxin HigA